VWVIIGKENKIEAIHDYSVVVSQYGLPKEAVGTIGVIGPTRMPYARTIATVGYLSSVLSGLAAKLYGREMPAESNMNASN
jgi:heat-inducible transcriptional repressor